MKQKSETYAMKHEEFVTVTKPSNQITGESDRIYLIPLPGYILAPLNRQSSVLKHQKSNTKLYTISIS